MGLLWPGFLLLLVLVPIIIGGYVWALRRRRRTGLRYSSLALVREAVPRSSRIRRHLPFGLFVLAVVGLTLAAARPVAIVSVPTGHKTIILSIDVSGSMCSTDISPTRLQAAEDAAAAFIRSQSSSTQIGIVAFAGFAAVVQPPTTDQQALLDTLNQLRTGRRTAVGSGILTSIASIEVRMPLPTAVRRPVRSCSSVSRSAC